MIALLMLDFEMNFKYLFCESALLSKDDTFLGGCTMVEEVALVALLFLHVPNKFLNVPFCLPILHCFVTKMDIRLL